MTLRIVVVRSAAVLTTARGAFAPLAAAGLTTARGALAPLAAAVLTTARRAFAPLAATGLTSARRGAATRRGTARRVIGELVVTFGIVTARFAAAILTTLVTFVFGIVGLSHSATIFVLNIFCDARPKRPPPRTPLGQALTDDASCDPFKQNTYHKQSAARISATAQTLFRAPTTVTGRKGLYQTIRTIHPTRYRTNT